MDPAVLAILSNVVNFMETQGLQRNLVTFEINRELVDEIYEATGRQYAIPDLKKAADYAFAHEWIKHNSIGNKYSYLGITDKGVGVVLSKRRQDTNRKNRKLFKKISDYIEEHKGLFVFLGFAVAVATLAIKIWTGK